MSLLDPIRMAFECPLRWEKLIGGDRSRFCSECQKHVYNLSLLTRQEAEELLETAETPICIRVEIDAQGRSVHRPALPGLALSAALVAAAGIAEVARDSAAPACPSRGAPAPAAALDPTIPEVETPVSGQGQGEDPEPRVFLGEPAMPQREMMGRRR